ncbi:MAG: hypothetical protein LC808_06190, partial [Actinobacteria bacterium]|nr:hypothetical protein [Actinomycetota bacterium]
MLGRVQVVLGAGAATPIREWPEQTTATTSSAGSPEPALGFATAATCAGGALVGDRHIIRERSRRDRRFEARRDRPTSGVVRWSEHPITPPGCWWRNDDRGPAGGTLIGAGALAAPVQ